MKKIITLLVIIAVLTSTQLVGFAQTKLTYFKTVTLTEFVDNDPMDVLKGVVESAARAKKDNEYYTVIEESTNDDFQQVVTPDKLSLKDIMRMQSIR